MRIFSWNVNGITPFLQKSITCFFKTSPKSGPVDNRIPPASLREFLRRHHWPAMLLLQEAKIARKDIKTQDAVRAAINTSTSSNIGEPTYEAHFTLPNDPHNAKGPRGSGKVYGVFSILRSDLAPKYSMNVRTVDWDAEGRISVVEVNTPEAKFAVFNIYAVNGTDNPYCDPKTGVQKGTRHDRKLAVHRLLAEECKTLEEAGWHILLGGDMNVAPDARDGYPKLRTFPVQHTLNRSDFHSKFLQGKDNSKQGFGGIDVWRQQHGEERRYTYHSRGREWGTSCDRVDYFIDGRKLWDAGLIKGSGVLDSEAERGPSDHVPIWVDITFPPSFRRDLDHAPRLLKTRHLLL